MLVSNVSKPTLDEPQKGLAVQLITQGKYTEKDIIYIRLAQDLSEGFAFTKDSFCVYGNPENSIIYYDSITDVEKTYIVPTSRFINSLKISYENDKVCNLCFKGENVYSVYISTYLYNYLNAVKNMIK